MEALYYLSTHTARVTLTDAAGDPVLGADSVDVTLRDKNGDDVAGQSWPLSLTEIGAGVYEGTVLHSVTVTKTDRLKMIVDAVKGLTFSHLEETVRVVVDGK